MPATRASFQAAPLETLLYAEDLWSHTICQDICIDHKLLRAGRLVNLRAQQLQKGQGLSLRPVERLDVGRIERFW